MKRYFIYSTSYKHSLGGISAHGHIITNGEYPSRLSVMRHHRIPSNAINTCVVTEVKSVQDIKDYFDLKEKEIKDESNYPFKSSEF